MKEYVFIFRGGMGDMSKATPEQIESVRQAWGNWYEKMGASVKDFGAPLQPGGKHIVAKVGTPNDNPYQKKKEIISGYSVIKAKNYTEAVKHAKACPIIQAGGSVEVREVMPMSM
jgi:hypothetical protein